MLSTKGVSGHVPKSAKALQFWAREADRRGETSDQKKPCYPAQLMSDTEEEGEEEGGGRSCSPYEFNSTKMLSLFVKIEIINRIYHYLY